MTGLTFTVTRLPNNAHDTLVLVADNVVRCRVCDHYPIGTACAHYACPGRSPLPQPLHHPSQDHREGDGLVHQTEVADA